MAIVDAKEMLLRAGDGGYAVGAFNITNIIQMEAVLEAAVEASAPLIIQTSVTPAKFLGERVLAAAYRTLAADAPVPVCLHIDHCTDVAYCKACAEAGYTNIMIDASKNDFEENIRQTREVSDFSHRLGAISVEGELGTVGGVEDQVRVVEDEAQLCDPETAVDFVVRSGIDIFAPAIGTAHGVYKTADPKVDSDRFEKIRVAIDRKGLRVPLVVHGGTGLPESTVRRLVELGGTKFNVSTDLKHRLLDATFDYLTAHRDEYNPGKLDMAVKASTKELIHNWIGRLGCAGKA
jgi:ketose-bisphosphate aldolase